MRRSLRGNIARGIIIAYSSLTLAVIMVSAASVAGIWFSRQKAILAARQQQEMAMLSARIRSETLLLTNSIQRYVVEPQSGDIERLGIEKQIGVLEGLLQQAINKVDPNNIDESIAVGRVLQYLLSFKVQSRIVLNLSDRENGFGPETKNQMKILVEHYQSELIGSLEDFENFERDAADLSYVRADVYSNRVTAFIILLSALAVIFAIGMSVWLTRWFVVPLTALIENVKLPPEASLNTPIEINSADEMGALAQALNRMKEEINESRRKLEEYADTLELQVEERTRELKLLAITDSLTGAYSRGHFFALAEQALKEAKRLNHPFSMAIFDIDHFKTVNDQFGHEAGDHVLQQATLTMQSQIRQMDILGRYGGEEFVVALPTANGEEAIQIGRRIVPAVQEMRVNYQGHGIHITVSGGVAAYAHTNEDLGNILSNADKALYTAKEQGRDRVVAYNNRA